MTEQHFDELIRGILEDLKDSKKVHSTDIPNIDLYMDQVTTFMDDHLGKLKRNDEEKVLTKTMINNYSKYGLLPPTNKKKYTNEHIIIMLFIYYLKPILSITDIKALINPLNDFFIQKGIDPNLLDIKAFNDRLIDSEKAHFHLFEERMLDTLKASKNLFDDIENEQQRELLEIFSAAYMMTVQASAQRFLVTKMIDEYLQKHDDK
jgi:DNA-binding transcriptional MerR regulator